MPSTSRLSTIPNGREAIDNLRGKVVQLRSAAIPRAASAAESTGEAVSKFALSSSKQVAKALRQHRPSKSTPLATLLPFAPLLRTGVRFAARNPVILAVAGVGLAALAVAAWRRQHSAAAPEAAEEADEMDDGFDDLGVGREL